MKLRQATTISIGTNIVLVIILMFIGFNSLKNGNQSIDESSRSEIVETVCDLAVQEHQENNIEVYSGKPATVNFESNPDAAMFRSTIASQVALGANFAGHYAVATWGCGTECQGYAIADVLTGKIIEFVPNHPFQASEGLSFSVNSNVLVFNPKPNISGNKTAVEVLQEDFEARKGRVYYLLTENEDSDVSLSTLCIENLYSGLLK